MAKKKATAVEMVGKRVKLNQAGLNNGYLSSFGGTTGPFRVISSTESAVYIDVPFLKGSYPNGYAISTIYVDLVEPDTIESLEQESKDLDKDLKKIESNIENTNMKIKFMKENNLIEFSETDFKAYAILTIIDNPNTSQIEKARAISRLVEA